MIDIEKMDKEAVYDVMLDLLYSINVGWFKMETPLKKVYSSLNKDAELNRLLVQINEAVGRYEARRLMKTLDIRGSDTESMIKVLNHSHWFAFENIQIERLSEKCFRMKTINCTTQNASIKKGYGHYDCTTGVSLTLRKAFFTEINSSASIIKVFAPPDNRPASLDGHVSCAWEISID